MGQMDISFHKMFFLSYKDHHSVFYVIIDHTRVCVLCLAGFAGTPGYLSPEVLRKDPYGRPVDVWACG